MHRKPAELMFGFEIVTGCGFGNLSSQFEPLGLHQRGDIEVFFLTAGS